MPDDDIFLLRRLARIAIKEGRFPDREPDHVSGGAARGGAICALCELLIVTCASELEIEFGTATGPMRFLAHPRCFIAWMMERS